LDFIEFKQKQVSIALAEKLDYDQAAECLGINASELRDLIAALESKLCLSIFQVDEGHPFLTDDGRFLIKIFREALSQHDRS
jgi:DNA-binding transcriptional LysR family regulator